MRTFKLLLAMALSWWLD